MPLTLTQTPPKRASQFEPEEFLDFSRIQQRKQTLADRETTRGRLDHAKISLLRQTRPSPPPKKKMMKNPGLTIGAALAAGFVAGRNDLVKKFAIASMAKIAISHVLRTLR